jgi:hypothetical protein
MLSTHAVHTALFIGMVYFIINYIIANDIHDLILHNKLVLVYLYDIHNICFKYLSFASLARLVIEYTYIYFVTTRL